MVRGYTTIKQSKRLLSLGLDQGTADMHYEDCTETFKLHASPSEYGYEYNIPTWSLTALLELMPDVHLKKYNYDGNTNYYITKVGIDTYTTDHYDFPIDAAFEMICWLIEQRYIKVNK